MTDAQVWSRSTAALKLKSVLQWVGGVVVRIPPIKQEVEGSNPISANPREVR